VYHPVMDHPLYPHVLGLLSALLEQSGGGLAAPGFLGPPVQGGGPQFLGPPVHPGDGPGFLGPPVHPGDEGHGQGFGQGPGDLGKNPDLSFKTRQQMGVFSGVHPGVGPVSDYLPAHLFGPGN